MCCWRSVVPCLSLALPWGRVHIYRMDFVIHPLPSLAGFRYEVIILKYLQQPLLVPSHTITSLYWTPGLELRSPVTRPIFMRSLLTAGQGSISHQSLMFTCFTFYGCWGNNIVKFMFRRSWDWKKNSAYKHIYIHIYDIILFFLLFCNISSKFLDLNLTTCYQKLLIVWSSLTCLKGSQKPNNACPWFYLFMNPELSYLQ